MKTEAPTNTFFSLIVLDKGINEKDPRNTNKAMIARYTGSPTAKDTFHINVVIKTRINCNEKKKKKKMNNTLLCFCTC